MKDTKTLICILIISLLVVLVCGMWFHIGRTCAPKPDYDGMVVWINDYLQVCVMDEKGITHKWAWEDLVYTPDLQAMVEEYGW